MEPLDKILCMTPLQRPDPFLVYALKEANALCVLELGTNRQSATRALAQLDALGVTRFGVRIAEETPFDPTSMLDKAELVVVASLEHMALCKGKTVLVQVTSRDEALAARDGGAYGLIVKGCESGGRVGEKSAFVLFQQLAATISLPLYVQGGIAEHTAAACMAAGASGVVLDSQLALAPESTLNIAIKKAIAAMDGGETRIIAGHRLFNRADLPVFKLENDTNATEIMARLGGDDLLEQYLPMGQDAALAKHLTKTHGDAPSIIKAIHEAIKRDLAYALTHSTLGPDSAFASAHRIARPLAMGPMSRISDHPAFAARIAAAGGLPFMALSVLRGEKVRELLEASRALMGHQPWGVGLLGFIAPELLTEQMAALSECRPHAAILAGGNAAQARSLEELSVAAYLHAPSVSLLDMFLKEGVRKFVFEGRECGGHIGPLSSFCLWELAMHRLMKHDNPEELHILFAGGIHDARSAAMISTLSAPLARRGAKIGVLMGTAYLFTREAVETGAIMPAYQQKAIACEETLELLTGPGHITRCTASEFTDFFQREKTAMKQRGLDTRTIHLELEKLNLGRLRIAARGEAHKDKTIIMVDEPTQLAQGMYSVGQLASLRTSVVTIDQLHMDVSEGSQKFLDETHSSKLAEILLDADSSYRAPLAKPLDIAIVGMACIYPEAKNVDEFWLNVLSTKNQVREISADRWSVETYYDATGALAGEKTPSKWGGFIPEIDINPGEFGIPPKALLSIEPTQILALKVARDALSDAGYLTKPFDRHRTAVFFGGSTGTDLSGAYGLRALFPKIFGDIPPELDEILPKLTEDSFPGILANVIAGRVSNRLDLRGASCTVDAACASSLAALNLAAKELTTGTSDMVLCGGADLHTTINDYLLFSSVHALSSRDKCSPFDENADGTILGEGIACLVLKRLDDAKRDGDRIYSVIKGLGASSDGKNLGIAAPSKEGQTHSLKRAYEQACISPAQVELVEAHGTGTVVGDKVELSALSEVFLAAGSPRASCTLGSVKSQIGHTKAAAGMAGLIKASKAIYHGTLPPTIHIGKPNPYYQREESPFVFRSIPRPWSTAERIAGVSSFGFGGANYHVVLAADECNTRPIKSPGSWPYELFLFRGKTKADALLALGPLDELLAGATDLRLGDLALSISTDSQHPVQFAALVGDQQDLKNKIGELKTGKEQIKDVFFAPAKPLVSQDSAGYPAQKSVVFLLPGQGSQRPAMAHELFVMFPRLQRYLAMTHDSYGRDLIETLYPPTAFAADDVKKQAAALKDTRFAQTAIGTVELAMAELLRMTGIIPDMIAGHSYGEITALCLGGAFDKNDLVAITRARIDSILMALDPQDAGAMAAVMCAMDKLQELLGGRLDNDSLAVANINAPDQVVITGTSAAVREAVDLLAREGVEAKMLPVACAFHSPQLASATELFRRKISHFTWSVPTTPVWSNTTAGAHSQSTDEILTEISRQIKCPVRFAEQVQAMYDAGGRIFIEVGPGNVLSGLTEKILKGHDHAVISLEQSGESSLATFLRALARMATLGLPVDIMGLYVDRDIKQIDRAALQLVKRDDTKLWVLDGHAAWPKTGKEPQGCLRTTKRVTLHGAPGISHEAEQSVTDYLLNMRQLTKVQYDVMMRYLGGSTTTLENDLRTLPAHQLKITRTETARSPKPVVAELKSADSGPVPNRDVRSVLLEVVSDKTGYPQDMLDLDLDMEADLSIDSIKRIEILSTLAERLGVNLRDAARGNVIEETSKNKTLRAIITFFEKQFDAFPPQKTSEDEGEKFVEIRTVQKQLGTDLTLLVQEIIAEKTGYPIDMLNPDLDLEADLSIDSIKRIEILSMLKNKLELAIVADPSGANKGAVVSSKTIRDIVAWLRTQLESTGPAEVKGDKSPATSGKTDTTESRIPLQRYTYGFKELPLIETMPTTDQLVGQRIVVSEDSLGIARLLADKLKGKGAVVKVTPFHGGARAPDLTDCDMFIHLATLGETVSATPIAHSFEWIKEALGADVKKLMVGTSQGGLFGHNRTEKDAMIVSGLAGILHTVSHEYPEVSTRLVDVEPTLDPQAIAQVLYLESTFNQSGLEIGYQDAKRFRRIAVKAEKTRQPATHPVKLDNESVILVTGGARGITAKCVLELAHRYGSHFEIAGRTTLPTAPDDELHNAPDLGAIRKILIQRGHRRPAEIEALCQRALAEGQLTRTLEAIRTAGGSVTYHAIDTRDRDTFGALIDEVYARRGKIDGFIHGAGILEDRFIKDKTVSSFAKVFDTKVEGTKVMAAKARRETKFALFFSSVAGCFGNSGQVDYAAANDAMDRIAWWLSRRIDGRCLTINWGPWDGTGMVTPELEREYIKRGIGLIDVSEGIKAMLDELLEGNREEVQVVYMCAALADLSTFLDEQESSAA